MEKLEITKTAALKAHEEANRKGKALLENLFGKNIFKKDIMARIQSFEDACEELGLDPDEIIPDFSFLSEDQEKGMIAHFKLIIIAQALNEGWRPDFKNSNEYKYWTWFYMDDLLSKFAGSAYATSAYTPSSSDADIGSRLCYKTEALAKHAGNTFMDLYRDYLIMQ